MATRSETTTSSVDTRPLWIPRLTLAQRRNVLGYIFISPFVLGFLIWFLIPAGVAAYLTTQKWDLINAPEYVGTANIEQLLSDPLLPQTLKATFIYTAVSVPVGLVFSFGLALLISNELPGISIFRTIFYLPSIVPAVANAALWAWMAPPRSSSSRAPSASRPSKACPCPTASHAASWTRSCGSCWSGC